MMSQYVEITASTYLDDFVDSYWTFSGNKKVASFSVLPDNCVDLIFDFTNNKAYLSGIMLHSQQRELVENARILGLRLRAEQLAKLIHVPLDVTKNARLELLDLLSVDTTIDWNRFYSLEKTISQIDYLEKNLKNTLLQSQKAYDELIVAVVRKIRNSHGNVCIVSIAKSNYISLRQLERRFKRFVGITIKEFSQIERFKYARKLIMGCQDKSLLEIAVTTGFYDHSHMNTAFKRITGFNPSDFR